MYFDLGAANYRYQSDVYHEVSGCGTLILVAPFTVFSILKSLLSRVRVAEVLRHPVASCNGETLSVRRCLRWDGGVAALAMHHEVHRCCLCSTAQVGDAVG
jgi:hypothetical protein